MDKAVSGIWITGVQAADAAKVWPHVAHWVADALAHGDELTLPADLLGCIEQRDMQLWLVMDGTAAVAVFITEVLNYPHGAVLTVVVLAGHGMDAWLPQVEGTISDFARAFGCRFVRLHGRRGWVRQLAGYGWHEQSVNMAKEV